METADRKPRLSHCVASLSLPREWGKNGYESQKQFAKYASISQGKTCSHICTSQKQLIPQLRTGCSSRGTAAPSNQPEFGTRRKTCRPCIVAPPNRSAIRFRNNGQRENAMLSSTW